MHRAARYNSIAVAELLISNGADIHVEDKVKQCLSPAQHFTDLITVITLSPLLAQLLKICWNALNVVAGFQLYI